MLSLNKTYFPRCPTYPELAPSCRLVTDPNDECCKVPECSPDPITGQNPVQIPVFLPATQNHGSVQPPTMIDLTSGQYSMTVYLVQTGMTPVPPTIPSGYSPNPDGIGKYGDYVLTIAMIVWFHVSLYGHGDVVECKVSYFSL